MDAGGGWAGTASPLRLADTKLAEEDNRNQGLDNNKALAAAFSIAAQTNHYTSLPTASCGSQVSPNLRQEAGEAPRPRKPVTCLACAASNSRSHERGLRKECDNRQGTPKGHLGRKGRGCQAESAGRRAGGGWGRRDGKDCLNQTQKGFFSKGWGPDHLWPHQEPTQNKLQPKGYSEKGGGPS